MSEMKRTWIEGVEYSYDANEEYEKPFEKAEELFKRSEKEAKFRLETFKRRTTWNVEE